MIKNSVVLCGGGTAGHIMPLIALMDVLPAYFNDIHYIGSQNGLEVELTKGLNLTYHSVSCIKFKRKFCLDNLAIPFTLSKGIKEAKKLLKEINPRIVISKGGYVALPTAIASQKLKIPVITHESDITMGLANKIIAKRAKLICTSFPQTATKYKKRGLHTGIPLRKSILKPNYENGADIMNFKQSKPIICVIGGSMGSKFINELIRNNLSWLTAQYNIFHVAGKNNIIEKLENASYHQIEFSHQIADILYASDLVISRAGSTTINELLTLKKPMILLPLSKAESRGDQVLNAEYFFNAGFAEVIYDKNISQKKLKSTIDAVLLNKNYYIKNMSASPMSLGTKNMIKAILSV